MKRALILILTLSIGAFGCGWLLDHLQQKTAIKYLDGLNAIRQLILENDLTGAEREHAELHEQWQQDAHWMNALLDHHHTRDVEAGMRYLATTLQEQNRLHALLALDELIDALEEVAQWRMAFWENIM